VAAQDRAELPTEVLRVVDRARQPEPARGRVAVGRVADEEDATDLERRRDHSLHRPARDLVDLHREVADAERGAGVGLHLRVRLCGIDRVVEVDHPFLGVRPPALRPHRDHHDEDSRLRGEDPADEHVWIRGQGREVRRHVERRLLGDDAQALVLHADEAGDPPSAVGADDVLAAHLVLRARAVVADRGEDAVVVLLEGDELVVEADATRRQLLGPRLQQRLEADLREVELAPGARGAPGLVGAPGAPALELRQLPAVIGVGATEAGVERGGRHLLGRGAALGDRLGDADVVEDLHRALVEDVRLGQIRGGRPRADQQVLDALLGQQHRRGQAGAATADDQDRDGLGAPSGH
jgi:hypothetical protein